MISISKVLCGLLVLIGISDIFLIGTFYDPIMDINKYNNMLNEYKYVFNCYILNRVSDYYVLRYNNSDYNLYDNTSLLIGGYTNCYISPNSNITYLELHYKSNKLYVSILMGGIALFIFMIGLLKCCFNTDDLCYNNKIKKSKLAKLVLKSYKKSSLIHKENNNEDNEYSYLIQSNNDNNSLSYNNRASIPNYLINSTYLGNPNYLSNPLYSGNSTSSGCDSYDSISLHSNNLRSSLSSNGSTSMLECMICYNEINIYVKLCNYEHYFCRECIIKLNRDFCIMCQLDINVDNVKIIEKAVV